MNFTEEEIKEGEKLIKSLYDEISPSGFFDEAKSRISTSFISAINCAIIAQKKEVSMWENVHYELGLTTYVDNKKTRAKRILQYLESL